MFPAGVHGSFASILFLPIIAQLALGIYLKLHIHEQTVRPYAVTAHGVLGKSYPILGWTQMLFGSLTYGGYCRGGHMGGSDLSDHLFISLTLRLQVNALLIISWVSVIPKVCAIDVYNVIYL